MGLGELHAKCGEGQSGEDREVRVIADTWDGYRVTLPVSIESCKGANMSQDLIRRGDNERLLFSETPLPQLTAFRVEGTYEVSLSEGVRAG